MTSQTRVALAVVVGSFVVVQSAAQDTTQRAAAAQSPSTSAPPLVVHVEHIRPGLTAPVGVQPRNPYEGDAKAVDAGSKLFIAYNCLDCHGAGGSGAMGPSLADGRWHFGGTSGELYESIAQGRPEGMPAWSSLISAEQIWQLVTYVQSLSAGKNVTTENFTGQTVERTGH